MADEIFDSLADRTVSINLTGGEPFLLPHLFDLIEHLHGFANLEEIHIITNGTKAGEALLEGIESSPKIGTLKVSLESVRSETNDAIRGRGNSKRVDASIEKFLATNRPVVLMVTLARYNFDHVAETIEWARARGLAGVIFERFVPLGRGRGVASQVLSARYWRAAVKGIAEASGTDAEPEKLAAYRAFWVRFGETTPELRGALCNLGDEAMALMPDGTVYPCRRLTVPQGRLLETSFDEVLARLGEFRFSELRSRVIGDRCGPCRVSDCVGCRALAHALTGDLLADDPQCFSSC